MVQYKIHRQVFLSVLLLTQSYASYASMATQIQNTIQLLQALKVNPTQPSGGGPAGGNNPPVNHNPTNPKPGFGPQAIISPSSSGQYNISQLSTANSVNDLYKIFGGTSDINYVTHCAPSTTTTFAEIGSVGIAMGTNGILYLGENPQTNGPVFDIDTLFSTLSIQNGIGLLLVGTDANGNILTTLAGSTLPSAFYLIAWDMQSVMLLAAPVKATSGQFSFPVATTANPTTYHWGNPWTNSCAFDIANVTGSLNGQYPFALQVISALPVVPVTQVNGEPIGFVSPAQGSVKSLNIELNFGVNSQSVIVPIAPADIDSINVILGSGQSVELEYNVIQRADNSCFDLVYTLYEYNTIEGVATNVIGGGRVNGLSDNGSMIIPVTAVGATVAWNQSSVSYVLGQSAQQPDTLPSIEAATTGTPSASGQITYQAQGWLINGSPVGNYPGLVSWFNSYRSVTELTLTCSQIPPNMLFFNVVNQGLAFFGGWNEYVTQYALSGALLPAQINWISGVVMIILGYDAQGEILTDLSTLGTSGPAKLYLYCYDYATGALLSGSPLNITDSLITDMNTALQGTNQYILVDEINKWDNNCMGAAANIGDWSQYDYKNQKANQYPLAVVIHAKPDAPQVDFTKLTQSQVTTAASAGPFNNPQFATMTDLTNLFKSVSTCKFTQVASSQSPSGFAYFNIGTHGGTSGGGVAIGSAPTNLPNSPVLSLASLSLTQQNWDNGVQLVLLAFDSNNHLILSISAKPASLYLYAYDLPSGKLLGDPINVGIGTKFVQPGIPNSMPTCWNNKMASNGHTETKSIVGGNFGDFLIGSTLEFGYPDLTGSYPMILTLQTKLGALPTGSTTPTGANSIAQASSLTTYNALQNYFGHLGASLTTVQTSGAAITTNPTYVNMNITGVGGIMWYANRWNASWPVAPDVSAVTAGNWTAPGLTWVLLGIDSSGNIIADLTKTTPAQFALNIYNISTGSLISSTAVPLSAITYNYSAAVTNASNAQWSNSFNFGGSSPAQPTWSTLSATYPVAWTISN